MSADPNCLFCKIVAKEIPAFVIYEDEETLAFLDIHPRAPGHAMVIPKYHAGKLSDLPHDKIGPLFASVARVAAKIETALALDGLSIGINQGAASGQEVDHVHVHLLPRFSGDGGGSVQSLVNHPPTETIQTILEKIRNTH